MLSRFKRYLGRSREFRRQGKFAVDIERYRRRVLRRQDLANFELDPVAKSRHRLVILGEDRVWKFYRGDRQKARNTVAVSGLLRSAGIRVPEILFSDVGKRTREKHGLNCVVTERLDCKALGRELSPEQVRQLARFLARLHSIRSEQWGYCHDLKTEDYFEQTFLEQIRLRMDLIEEWIEATGQKPLPDLPAWLTRRRDLLSPPGGKYCLVMEDTHSKNFQAGPDGEILLVDLDSVRFLDFPVDLVQLAPIAKVRGVSRPAPFIDRFAASIRANFDDFLETYFSVAPAEFRNHWERTRDAYQVLQSVQGLHGIIRRHQARFSVYDSLEPEEIDRLAQGPYEQILRIAAEA